MVFTYPFNFESLPFIDKSHCLILTMSPYVFSSISKVGLG